MANLLLYTTSACHLCDTAKALILPHLPSRQLSLKLVEISNSDKLMASYGIRIPVLGIEGKEGDRNAELEWPFEQQELLAYIEGIGIS